MPMATALPAQSRQSRALRSTAGWPTQSKAHVTPPSGKSAPAADSRSAGTSSRTAAAVSPAFTLARFSTAPTPVRTPQPMRQADESGTSLGMRTAWTSLTIVTSEKTDAAAKFDAGSPLNVKGVEMLPRELLHHVGWPVPQARQAPQLARVAITT